MRKYPLLQIVALSLIALMLVSSRAQGAPQPNRSLLPGVYSPLDAPSLTEVLECACGFANSTIGPDGKVYTIAQRFDRGGKLYVYVLVGSELKEVADPGMVGPSSADNSQPAFGLPVQKNGPGSIFFTPPPNSKLVVIAPARPVGVVEGDYNLMMYQANLQDLHPETQQN